MLLYVVISVYHHHHNNITNTMFDESKLNPEARALIENSRRRCEQPDDYDRPKTVDDIIKKDGETQISDREEEADNARANNEESSQ